MRVTAVEAIPYAVPYVRPARFASGSITHAENVLVRVHTDEGIVGQAEAQPRPYTYGETQASIVAAVEQRLAAAVVGLNPFATERAHEACSTLAGNESARAAVDLALWDVVGKALGVSCRVLLGGYADEVRVAHMVGYDDPEVMARTAQAIRDAHGVTAFKIKVGRRVELDLEACRLIRAALPDAELYVDANRGWSYEQASAAGPQLIELGILAIEEPIAVDDRRGRRQLADGWRVPLQGDESCISLAHTARALDEGAVGSVSIKTARTGFTESRRILGLCQGHRVPVVMGSQYEGGVGALATATFAAAHAASSVRPAEIMNVFDLADDLLSEPIEVREGRFAIPDRPGLGVEIDEEKLRRYRIDAPNVMAVR
jgi:L-alanine-DL-glutamate epimerase-like enolase superfamily enzyme